MQHSHWTMLDITFIVIILISTIFALRKGLIREVISLVALIGGFLVAAFFYHGAASLFLDFAKTGAVADLLGFLTIFLGTILVGAVAAWIVNRFVKMASLEWVDRLLGGVFGLLRGWAVCSIIALALIAFPVRQETFARSVLTPYLLAGSRAAVFLVPASLKLKFNEEYQKVLQTRKQDRSTQ